MASQPPWESDDDTPPWEIADLDGAGDAEAMGKSQMADLMRPPSTGFRMADPKALAKALEAPDRPMPGDPAFYGDPSDPESIKEAGMHRGLEDAAPVAAAVAASPLLIPTTKAAAVRAGWGLLGSSAGGAGGAAIGSGLEKAGFPEGTSKALGIAGGLFGGGFGGIRGKKGFEQAKGIWDSIRGGGHQMSKESLALAERRLLLAEKRFAALQEKRAMDAAAKAAKAAEGGTAPVASKVKDAQTVANVESALKGSRVQSGAERVGRPLGKTKEQIRMETGPVLDEAVGDASPILPEKILFQMIDKMKSLPKTGGEREAYVARALDGKTKAQVENIRRTLQHLGLLLPVGVAGAMSQE